MPSTDFIPAEASAAIEELSLLPRPRWDAGLAANWTPGEAIRKQLEHFLADALDEYTRPGTRLPNQGPPACHPICTRGDQPPRGLGPSSERTSSQGMRSFARQLGWREFSRSILRQHPESPCAPCARNSKVSLAHRARGSGRLATRTDRLPDRGRRNAGTLADRLMHNRVRMIVGSLLVKHLLISWAEGAAWFWDTLVDADLANNTMGWQVGGCGADAAPYFRIFNPVTQSRNLTLKDITSVDGSPKSESCPTP